MRPTHCEVKWFSGAIGKIEVTGNVVSRETGLVGNPVISETFVIQAARAGEDVSPSQAYDGPDVVIEIFQAAALLGERGSTD